MLLRRRSGCALRRACDFSVRRESAEDLALEIARSALGNDDRGRADLPLTATELSDLAVKARNSAEQDRMIAQNVHAALPALLLEGTAPLETQAQAARLLANLAFQPPNKVVLTEAGAVEALQATLERALAVAAVEILFRRHSSFRRKTARGAVLVEAAAALGNLSSGRSLRERCADASCPVPRVLLRLVDLWSTDDRTRRSTPPPPRRRAR